MTLPDPGAVLDDAAAAAAPDALRDPGTLNVHVPAVDAPDHGDAGVSRREAGGYEGPGAGDRGRLAAATAAVADGPACLHYPDPQHAARGPWLVVEPTAGRLATVHCGRGTVRLTLEAPTGGVDDQVTGVRDRLSDVLERARPEHDHYPVREDEDGVFTTGMTTYTLDSVEVSIERVVVALSVSTTPSTRRGDVEGRFAGVDGVASVTYGASVGVERADPPDALRGAAEATATEVLGGYEYDWFPEPTAFSRVPCGAKLALGAGAPDAGAFDAGDHETCRELLAGTVARWGERR